jgi:hypothetical protein
MDEKSWRDGWEELSNADRARRDATPVKGLLSDVRYGRVGDSYGIWHSIALRSTPAEAGWTFITCTNSTVQPHSCTCLAWSRS